MFKDREDKIISTFLVDISVDIVSNQRILVG